VHDALLQPYSRILGAWGFRSLKTPRDSGSWVPIYQHVPYRYPPLLEALCLTYSWDEAVIGEVELAPNPEGAGLSGWASSVRYDSHLWDYLLPRGYLIFGRMSGGRYDPCAFNMIRRNGTDAPVVRVDHEEVLSFLRLGEPSLLAPSFRALLDDALAKADGAA
jgi:hypothetical protein